MCDGTARLRCDWEEFEELSAVAIHDLLNFLIAGYVLEIEFR